MNRPDRVAELIKKEISMILREKVSDPRIGFLSVTGVDISPDLKNARIYVSVLGDEKVRQDTLAGLESATSFIKGELGHILNLRYVPDIIFVYDKSLESGSRVLTIMNRLEREAKEAENLTHRKTGGGQLPRPSRPSRHRRRPKR